MNEIEVKLELVSNKNCDDDEIFYRYRVGRYAFWFVQHQDNHKKKKHQNCVGCIFIVQVQSDDRADFDLIVNTKIGSGLGYPDDFSIDNIPHTLDIVNAEIVNIPHTLDIDDYDEFASRLEYAKVHLQKIKSFLYNSIHYELFKKRELLK